MPARPMFRSPHKKSNPWAHGYTPSFSRRPTRGDDKGGVPTGKKKKQDRIKQNPPGYPMGRHIDDGEVKKLGLVACFCGGHYLQNNGRELCKFG